MDAIGTGWSWPACRSRTWSLIRTTLGAVMRCSGAASRRGQYRPIVVNRPTGEVLAGNHTLLAARELGGRRSPSPSSTSTRSRRSGSCWPTTAPATSPATTPQNWPSCCTSCDDLEGTGYDQAALGELLDEVDPASCRRGRRGPGPPAEPGPGRATLATGRHRLLCGDAREPGVLPRLLGGEQAAAALDRPALRRRLRGQDRAAAADRERRSRPGWMRCSETRSRASTRLWLPGRRLYVAHPAGALVAAHSRRRFVAQGWRFARRWSG